MNTQREVVIVSGVRTAVGDFGGGLKDVAPTELGAQVVHEALARARVAGDEVGQVVFGNVIHTEPKDMYLARVAAMNAGVAKETPALTLNRLCGSGLQAIVSAAQTIMLGDTDIAVGGGAESMSSRAVHRSGRALGRAHGRRDDGGHDAGRAARPVRQHPYGRNRREPGGEPSDHSRRSGRAGAGIASPRLARDLRGALQAADPAGEAEDTPRRDGVRHRRTSARRCHSR